jgi:hypothetical protein
MPTDPPAQSSSNDVRVKLGLSENLLREMIGRSIGISGIPLPVRLEHSLELVGLFRAKQLAYELLQAVKDARLAVKRMRIRLANREPTDDDWIVIQYEYAEIWSERDLLRARIDEDCENWYHYTEIAVPIYRSLDEFCGAIRQIAQGYKPKSMQAADEPRFPLSPPLKDFAQKVDFYMAAIESVWVEFGTWLKDCKQLYGTLCELLDGRV